MTGKSLMKSIEKTRREIKMLLEQIERYRHLAEQVTAIRYDKDKVQTSPEGDRMVDIIAKIDEKTDELKDKIYNLQLLEEDAIGYLVQIKKEHERVLSLHYFDDVGWQEVASIMGYHDKYIYEIRDKALEELDDVIRGK